MAPPEALVSGILQCLPGSHVFLLRCRDHGLEFGISFKGCGGEIADGAGAQAFPRQIYFADQVVDACRVEDIDGPLPVRVVGQR